MKYLVYTISSFRMCYAVEANSKEEATLKALQGENDEFDQEWMGEYDVLTQEISDEEMLKLIDEKFYGCIEFTPEDKFKRFVK